MKFGSIRGHAACAVTLTAGLAAGAALANGPIRPFNGTAFETLPSNDDGSAGPEVLDFVINFGGTFFDEVYVNNNGNITFNDSQSTFTPFNLNTTGTPIIAPFFADVDTRGVGSGLVSFGHIQVDGNDAFAVTWPGVGYYSNQTDKLNEFQVVIIDRPDTDINPSSPAGNFDIEFNYGQILWETGSASDGVNGFGGDSARAGYSNGSGVSFELPGSAINGAFLDGGQNALAENMRNSDETGRYVFEIRNDIVPGSRQDFPVLPEPRATPSEPFRFINVASGLWVDPPVAFGFEYEMLGDSLFTDILDFPVGFLDDFEVVVDGLSLGFFGPGEGVDFVSLLGDGVESFIVQNINPTVDPNDALAFPIQLAFDTQTADFTMTPLTRDDDGSNVIPSPTAAALGLGMLLGLGLTRRRR